jgi:hypothetical protein
MANRYRSIGLAVLVLVAGVGGGPTAGTAQVADATHRLNGTYGVILNQTCLTAPPGTFGPALQLLGDASSTFTASCTGRAHFDGRGHVRFLDNYCLGINTSLPPAGANSNLPSGGATYFSALGPLSAPFTCEGPYELDADGSLRFAFTCEVPAAAVSISATRVRGFVGQGQAGFVLGVVEPQVRTVSAGGVPVEEQFCVWNGTGERIAR